ncbi:MAG: serpin family protein, partial [Candidatus Latescibacterota bacterium]
SAMASLISTLERADSSVEITIANSLWGRDGFEFAHEFLKTNKAYFGAEVTTLDFDDPKSAQTINRWVEEATQGKIDSIVERIPPHIVLFLINAIYFNGQWQFEFDPSMTQDQTWHLSDGGEETAAMMTRFGSYLYLRREGFQAVRLPYGTGRLAMYVFLPDSPSGLEQLLAGLNVDTWSQWIASFRSKDGVVMLPRFKIEYMSRLNSALEAMGMGVAFQEGRADFSGMPAAPADLFVSEVIHKAVVEVNEEGTEAAAVTKVSIGVTSVQPEEERFEFVADHPFFFVIYDELSQSILFLGILNNPSEQ